MYLLYQVCPEGPCGSAMTAGTQYNLPTIAAPEGPPCVGFSVGENGDGNVPALATECGGDLIRIDGKRCSVFKRLDMIFCSNLHTKRL